MAKIYYALYQTLASNIIKHANTKNPVSLKSSTKNNIIKFSFKLYIKIPQCIQRTSMSLKPY